MQPQPFWDGTLLTISAYCYDDAGNDHLKPGLWVNTDGGAVIQIAPPITTPSDSRLGDLNLHDSPAYRSIHDLYAGRCS